MATEETRKRCQKDIQKAAQGIARITWEKSDDEFSSGMVYGSTGAAGHGHGGPGF